MKSPKLLKVGQVIMKPQKSQLSSQFEQFTIESRESKPEGGWQPDFQNGCEVLGLIAKGRWAKQCKTKDWKRE